MKQHVLLATLLLLAPYAGAQDPVLDGQLAVYSTSDTTTLILDGGSNATRNGTGWLTLPVEPGLYTYKLIKTTGTTTTTTTFPLRVVDPATLTTALSAEVAALRQQQALLRNETHGLPASVAALDARLGALETRITAMDTARQNESSALRTAILENRVPPDVARAKDVAPLLREQTYLDAAADDARQRDEHAQTYTAAVDDVRSAQGLQGLSVTLTLLLAAVVVGLYLQLRRIQKRLDDALANQGTKTWSSEALEARTQELEDAAETPPQRLPVPQEAPARRTPAPPAETVQGGAFRVA